MSGLSRWKGRWFVVKVGGELALDRARLAASVGESIRRFREAGIQVAVVHGGGPQATELSRRLSIPTRQVGGRRVTDDATLEVMKMTLAGQVSVDVASALALAGLPALCTTGVSAGLVVACKRPPVAMPGEGQPVDFGHVGDVVSVDVGLLQRLHEAGVLPVFGSLAADEKGNVYNVNADTVATRVAAKLRAAKLFLVSNVPGVLRDKNDPNSRVSRLTPALARAQMEGGTIVGGMAVKVEESLAMLAQGVEAIHIVGIDPPDSLLREAQAPGSVGTAFDAD